mmetsp:Transcript_1117/g.3250  ORF Transcript_1117/g.3250 Transcript_1117/m.3250 type:complete len:318 (+) Transcript_1117:2-955(+)
MFVRSDAPLSDMSRPSGYIFLDEENAVVAEQLRKYASLSKKEVLNTRLTDFDDCLLVMEAGRDSQVLHLNLAMPRLRDILSAGGQEMLEEEYKPYLTDPQEGFDVAIAADFGALPEDVDTVISKFAGLKQRLLAAPFRALFRKLLSGASTPSTARVVPYRSKETAYLVPSADRVVCVFSVYFADVTDSALARVILQEFADVGRVVGEAPPCNFSVDPPRELKDMTLREDVGAPGHVGFVSFAVLREHIATPNKLHKVSSLLATFRAYLMYHIKATKSHLHTRMRRRVALMQQVLNRAVPEKQDGAKKLASGRVFVRK